MILTLVGWLFTLVAAIYYGYKWQEECNENDFLFEENMDLKQEVKTLEQDIAWLRAKPPTPLSDNIRETDKLLDETNKTYPDPDPDPQDRR